MRKTEKSAATSGAKVAWSILVVSEDSAARDRAVGFCNQLVGRFWSRFEFDVSWYLFAQLTESGLANEAAEKAALADLVVVSATREGDFPLPVRGWLEAWVSRRGKREGTLVALMGPPGSRLSPEGPKHYSLRSAAHRLAMDYLTQIPQELSRIIPDSLESYTSRADEVTSLLANILHHRAPPPSPLL